VAVRSEEGRRDGTDGVPVEAGEQVLRLQVASGDRHRDHRTPHPEARQIVHGEMERDAPVVTGETRMPARGAHKISVGKDDVVAGDDLAVAKGELAGGVGAPGDEPPSDHVEATVEEIPAVLVADDAVGHARKEKGVESTVFVRVEDEARDRLLAQRVQKGRRLGLPGRRRRHGRLGSGPCLVLSQRVG